MGEPTANRNLCGALILIRPVTIETIYLDSRNPAETLDRQSPGTKVVVPVDCVMPTKTFIVSRFNEAILDETFTYRASASLLPEAAPMFRAIAEYTQANELSSFSEHSAGAGGSLTAAGPSAGAVAKASVGVLLC